MDDSKHKIVSLKNLTDGQCLTLKGPAEFRIGKLKSLAGDLGPLPVTWLSACYIGVDADDQLLISPSHC